MAHSVADHLHVQIADYDRAIRTFIPAYDEMRAVQLALLQQVIPERGGVVLDLGGGTGALAAAIAEQCPNARVEIWDTDRAMLQIARERCASFGPRVALVERSFADPLPDCDAVVACIALHHVKDLSAKGAIYRNIHQALRAGGIFLNADICASTQGVIRSHLFDSWAAFMLTQGITAQQSAQHFSDWAKQDYYPPISAEFDLLRAAGFQEPDCSWRKGPCTIFGAIR